MTDESKPLPPLRARVGVRSIGARHWVPMTVDEIKEPHIIFRSPLFTSGRFAFVISDPWEWIPWSEAPVMRGPCPSCKGRGHFLKGEQKEVCGTCHGDGETERDDPFTN